MEIKSRKAPGVMGDVFSNARFSCDYRKMALGKFKKETQIFRAIK